MSRSTLLTMVRSATTTTAANSGRLEAPPNPNNVWKRGHVSRGSVGDKIQVIPGFKTSAGTYSVQMRYCLWLPCWREIST
jgi:hypothetical protein